MVTKIEDGIKIRKKNENLAFLHCLIFKEDAAFLKEISRYHGERAHLVRNLIKTYCDLIRAKQITQNTPLGEVFTNDTHQR